MDITPLYSRLQNYTAFQILALICNKNLRTSLLFLTIIYPVKAVSQDAASEWDFYSKLPVVLHATRLMQPVESAPAAVTLIDRRMIEASSATTIPEVLRYIPGFQVSYLGGNEIIPGFHGIADEYARRTQLLIDGRPIFNQTFAGSLLWSTLPVSLDEIERVEVVRSPNSASYGSNAFMGSINFVTRAAAGDKGSSVRLDVGSDDLVITNLRHSGRNEDTDYSLSVRYENGSGLPMRDDDMQGEFLNVHGGWQINSKDRLELSAGYTKDREWIGGGRVFWDLLTHRQAISHYQQIKWLHINAVDDEWQLTFGHNNLDVEGAGRARPPDTNDYPDNYSTDRLSLDMQRVQRIKGDVRLAWGGSIIHDRIKGKYYYTIYDYWPHDEGSMTQYSLFANAEWELSPSLFLNVGLMYEEYDADIMFEQYSGDPDFQDADTEKGIPSARIGLNYRVNDNHAARFIASRASRLPSYYEDLFGGSYYADPFDPDVPYTWIDHSSEIEKVDSFEIGYLGHFMNRKLSVDASLFYNDFESLQVEFADILPERYAKLHSYSHVGLDLEIRYAGKKNLMNLAYSYVDVLENDLLRLGLENRMSAPEHTLSLLYSHQFDHGWQAGASLFHVSDMRWTLDSASGGDVTWADLKLAKNIKTAKGEVHLALTAQNIFDESGVTLREDRSHPTVHSDGERRLLASLRYSF